MSVTSLLLLDETKRRHVIANSLELVEMTKGKVRMSSPLTSPTPCGHPVPPTVFGHGWQELMLLYLLNLSMMHH